MSTYRYPVQGPRKQATPHKVKQWRQHASTPPGVFLANVHPDNVHQPRPGYIWDGVKRNGRWGFVQVPEGTPGAG